ncbi:Fur family transcriptional regulator [Carboxydochorda subterranea]|uniref:Fur family transcriptional regulator n=1 Tax=Carboxydichorda subterranea TaxID=3109565 RepID=A0ABZ1BXH4_9FIRM|nr:Fur family transcriptional regulator [Limnochorda sp. L945t]WRP17501.1 Fur family transcriptional regulator [Limnochorda sp. L945t]
MAHDGKAHEQTVSSMLQALKAAGYRVTAARRAVVEAMQSSGHRSAREVVEEVRRRHPGVGRASVYRTLAILSKVCAVQPSLLGTTRAHYSAADQGSHHHFICNRCHRVIEFDECTAAGMVGDIEQRLGVRIQGHLLEFYGLCRSCLAAM